MPRTAQLLRLIAAAMLVLLAACGAQAPATAPTAAPAAQPTAAPAAVEPTAAAAAAAEEATPPGITVVSETADSRVIRHALGEATIPAQPQRIVALYGDLAADLYALGVPAIATTSFDGVEPPPYYQQVLDGLQIVGGVEAPNIEAVLAAAPDMILMVDWQGENGVYDQLSKIAPTVAMPDLTSDFRAQLRTVATIVGADERAEARLAEYDQKVAAARERLSAIGDETVAVLWVRPKQYRLYGSQSPIGVIYSDLGVTPAPLVPGGLTADGTWWEPLSFEVLPEFKADHLFMMSDSEEQLKALTDNPLWQSIPAVQAERIYPASPDWIIGGVQGREHVIDQVVASLAP